MERSVIADVRRGNTPGDRTVRSLGRDLLNAGRLREARLRFWEEARAAEDLCDGDALAEAALGLGGIWVHEHRNTIERAEVLGLQRRALAAVPPASSLAQRLRARLSAEASYCAEERVPAVFESVESACHSGDAVLAAEALSLAHHCLLGPHHQHQRLAITDQLLTVAPFTGRRIDLLMALTWRTVDFFLAGDRRAVRSLRELQAQIRKEGCDALQYVTDSIEVTLALRRGELDAAERLAEACLKLGQDVGDADAWGWYGAQLIALRWLQSRGNEIIGLLEELDESDTVAESNLGFTAALASLAVASEDQTIAQAALDRLRNGGLARLRPSSAWMPAMLGVCEAAHFLQEADVAWEAYQLLAPFARLPIMASLAVACFGSAHRPLGLAASTFGDHDRAVAHLEAAVQADSAFGNRPCRALDLGALAAVLAQRDSNADRARAVWTEAADAAQRVGMMVRAETWRTCGRPAFGLTAGPAPSDRAGIRGDPTSTGALDAEVTCRREGRGWVVGASGHSVFVAHSVGMTYLGCLVSQPGQAIAAIDLAGAPALVSTTNQDLLDTEAVARYRRRVDELRTELDRADARGDEARSVATRQELDAVLQELRSASGLGGRRRAFTDTPERARTSVQKALRRAVSAIAAHDRHLGDIIESRLVTGTRCVFYGAPGAGTSAETIC